jgi:type III restriction enzyme
MLEDVNRAKIVITNYHAFKLRERIDLSKGGRQLLQGGCGEEPDTQETEGQMIQRVMRDLMGMKNILVMNDEAHHRLVPRCSQPCCWVSSLKARPYP